MQMLRPHENRYGSVKLDNSFANFRHRNSMANQRYPEAERWHSPLSNDYEPGYIDPEERTLQPLENPFGPNVLATSQEQSVTYVSGPDSYLCVRNELLPMCPGMDNHANGAEGGA